MTRRRPGGGSDGGGSGNNRNHGDDGSPPSGDGNNRGPGQQSGPASGDGVNVDTDGIDNMAGRLQNTGGRVDGVGRQIETVQLGPEAMGMLGTGFTGAARTHVQAAGQHLGRTRKAVENAQDGTRATAQSYRDTDTTNATNLSGIDTDVTPPRTNQGGTTTPSGTDPSGSSNNPPGNNPPANNPPDDQSGGAPPANTPPQPRDTQRPNPGSALTKDELSPISSAGRTSGTRTGSGSTSWPRTRTTAARSTRTPSVRP